MTKAACLATRLALLLTLTACSAGSDPYGAGHGAGCRNGFIDAGGPSNSYAPKNEALYAADAAYRKGWDEGYRACFDRQISTPKTISGPAGR